MRTIYLEDGKERPANQTEELAIMLLENAIRYIQKDPDWCSIRTNDCDAMGKAIKALDCAMGLPSRSE